MLELFQNLFAPPRHMILLIAAAWIGLTLAEKRSERHSVGKDNLNNLTFYGLLAFVIGGRVSFVLQNIAIFIKKPIDIVSINPDLFDPLGAVATALLVALVYGQRKGLSLWSTLDALTPFFAVVAVGLGLSRLASGAGFGKETDIAWGIHQWNAVRHPTQLYETLASLLTFGLLWRIRRIPRPGILFLAFAALTSASQLIVQTFRAEGIILPNGIIREQVTAWVVLAVSFVLIEARFLSQKVREQAP
jgi:phosphatidylglycerol---prolipoprotein diacylglyceryl transferase